MANLVRNFIKGRMNKSVDERLVPNGEYIDAQNIRMGSTEDSEIGAVENTKGNEQLTTLVYPPTGDPLSAQAVCIGAYADGANETMYWFVHDPSFAAVGLTGKLDLIVSYNTVTQVITYHVVSIDDGTGFNTTLNFDQFNLITGVDLVEDLLFFTDDRNPPRRIDVTTNYPNPIASVDSPLLGEDILVIKAPPDNSPDIAAFDSGDEQNTYMEDRLLSFAYRYRYANGEYSATSQFSAPSFVAKPFLFTPESFTNEGMENATNACTITYNSGNELVVGIDLLFKEMDDNIIRVIEKLDKDDDGLADNTDYEYVFDNNKIYTILPESEILRLYDNVPLLSKAQTMMGNRLVYGNYTEGYDLLDQYGVPIRLDYFIGQIKLQAGMASLSSSVSQYFYNIGPTGFNSSSQVQFTFDNVDFTVGDSIQIVVNASHGAWTVSGGGAAPTSTTPQSTVTFIYTLTDNFSTVTEMVSSAGFLDAIGTAANIETTPANFGIANQSIFTNAWNSIFPLTQTGGIPDPQNLTGTGINNIAEPITVSASTDNSFTLRFPVPLYNGGAVDSAEAMTVTSAVGQYFSLVSQRSLHSNRTYQVGIVYMDEYNRATTVLTSESNTVHIPCSDSIFRNNIRVEIPVWERPPFWADRYKFVIKPDRENYETIYTNLYENFGGYTYFLLEGEQAAKVEKGDRYVVKADCGGATSTCLYATVLEKESYAVGGLDEPSIPAVPGTYMKIKADGIDLSCGENNTDTGWRTATTETAFPSPSLPYPQLTMGGTTDQSTNDEFLEAIPAGSRVTIDLEYERKGTGDGDNSCESRYLTFTQTFVVDENYGNVVEWFYGQDGVEDALNNTEGTAGDPLACVPTLRVYPQTDSQNDNYGMGNDVLCENKVCFFLVNNDCRFVTTGTNPCSGFTGLDVSNNRRSIAKARIRILRTNDVFVFETEPQDSLPDLWYESSVSYDIVGDFHQGNLRNQTALQSALIDTAFFNCITYGNGVESYKIRDSISGKPITMGNRVTTVSAQDYKQVRRFADLTYSGVYNDETNINKLNEFNLGLLNFKPLEDSYGPVEKLFGRRTDILTLQEDKISYVLAEKNLLTDSTGASVVTSIPEVLGQQVARVEDFGISNNPESFAEWGPHKFFTDAKRGSVIHLYGDGQKEQLTVISENGMRSWFRDMFIEDFNTQKLGGYDPYMNEYVLASNEVFLPGQEDCIECNTIQTFTLTLAQQSFCVNLGNNVGPVPVNYAIIDPVADDDEFTITTTYDGTSVTTGPITSASQPPVPSVNKYSIIENTLSIDLDYTPGVTGRPFVVQIQVKCPDAADLSLRLITLNRTEDAAQSIHSEFQWVDGIFTSPLSSTAVKFLAGTNPVVSNWQDFTVSQGANLGPTNGSTVIMAYNRIGTDNYTIRPTDRFRWLRSSTKYEQADIASLLADPAISDLVPAGADPEYKADFLMPSTSDEYLYLIWDYSGATPPPEEFLLDTYTGAAAGYSTRRLASSATVLMRVRRETAGGTGDDDEADVAYDSNNELSLDSAISNASAGVTATTLGQFLNVGTVNGTTYTNPDSLTVTASCFVDEWKDQSGNANHAEQTVPAQQPQIHSGTVNTDLITENGKPAIEFDGSNDYMDSPTMTVTDGEFMQLGVYATNSNTANSAVATIDTTVRVAQTLMFPNTTQIRLLTFNSLGNVDAIIGAATTSAGTQTLATAHVLSGQGEVFVNGTGALTGSVNVRTDQTNIRIGNNSGANAALDGRIQEVIHWPSEQTNRTDIEENINTDYLIYQPTDQPTSGLLYDYGSATGGTDAAAAYSVRQLSDKAVIALRVRRDSDDEEINIGWDANGDLDTTAISDFCDTANGYVTRWWDQSTNGNHADQATDASQPQIYNGTAVITENGKPALIFSTHSFSTSVSLSQPYTGISVGGIGSGVSRFDALYGTSLARGPHIRTSSSPWLYGLYSGAVLQGTTGASSQDLLTCLYNSTTSTMNLNGASEASGNIGTNNPSNLEIGDANQNWDGQIQEVIFYDSDQSSNRTGIESNVNTYFSIY